MKLQGVAQVDVLVVTPAPMKGITLLALDPFDVDVPPSKSSMYSSGKSSPMTPTILTGVKKLAASAK
jgi:hypothetical protein